MVLLQSTPSWCYCSPHPHGVIAVHTLMVLLQSTPSWCYCSPHPHGVIAVHTLMVLLQSTPSWCYCSPHPHGVIAVHTLMVLLQSTPSWCYCSPHPHGVIETTYSKNVLKNDQTLQPCTRVNVSSSQAKCNCISLLQKNSVSYDLDKETIKLEGQEWIGIYQYLDHSMM